MLPRGEEHSPSAVITPDSEEINSLMPTRGDSPSQSVSAVASPGSYGEYTL